MQQSIGELIRQLRRQRSMTQTELGGEQFSKSYVSAVERDKIIPSNEALHCFAERLEQPYNYLLSFIQTDTTHTVSTQASTSFQPQQKLHGLLHSLLELALHARSTCSCALPPLEPDLQETLPIEEQGYFAFLLGLNAQKQQNLSGALSALEQALALAPGYYQPAILDELGITYYRSHSYHTALNYHRRARQMLQDANIDDDSTRLINGSHTITSCTSPELSVRIEVHCGDDYSALGDYEKARDCYEQARLHLTVCQDLQIAAQLYSGLGYCTYTSAYQQTVVPLTGATLTNTEALEHAMQQALEYLGQSRNLYQISNDREEEMAVRLLQCMILIDFGHLLRQQLQTQLEDLQEQEATGLAGTPLSMHITTLLDEAREQCFQVLLYWQEAYSEDVAISPLAFTTLYTSLAYLIRIFIQYAAIARLGGLPDVAERERAMATQLCQLVLDTLNRAALSREQLRHLTLIIVQRSFNETSIPQLPHLPESALGIPHLHTIGQAETYFAAGEVAEEMGRVTPCVEEAKTCYQRADQCFQLALALARSIDKQDEHVTGTLMRLYQRNISILEERLQAHPQLAQEITKILLHLLKDDIVLT